MEAIHTDFFKVEMNVNTATLTDVETNEQHTYNLPGKYYPPHEIADALSNEGYTSVHWAGNDIDGFYISAQTDCSTWNITN